MNRITGETFIKLAREMEVFHGVFSQLWKMGKPRFSEQAKTAFVAFNKDGDFIDFCFNPKFWDDCSSIKRKFVICHESLHVMYSHGKRGRGMNRSIANKAMDIVINEGLVEQFGFDREDIDPKGEYCWIDTVFKNPDKIERNRCFEYYYDLLKKQREENKKSGKGGKGESGGSGEGSGDDEPEEGGTLVDSHEGLDSFDEEKIKEIVDAIKDALSPEELKALGDKLDEMDKEGSGGDKEAKSNSRGTMAGQIKTMIMKVQVVKKKKWETIIKKWARKYLRPSFKEVEQWAMLNRRLAMLPRNMFIPSDYEHEEKEKEEHKIEVWFFQDVSGSCTHLVERFYKAAKSLPEDRFVIKMHCFDTAVYEVDLKKNEVKGHGWGTYFSIIETYIQAEMKKKNLKYPDSVFVITDGMGDAVIPEKPEKWFWFLSMNVTNCIHKKSNIFKLEDFE